mgnify:CR=1 FL=1
MPTSPSPAHIREGSMHVLIGNKRRNTKGLQHTCCKQLKKQLLEIKFEKYSYFFSHGKKKIHIV